MIESSSQNVIMTDGFLISQERTPTMAKLKSLNSFNTQDNLQVGSQKFTYFNLNKFNEQFSQAKKLPFCLKILLENLLRHEDHLAVQKEDILSLANWNPTEEPSVEINFTPARVILQDFTGVPAVADLAALRDAMTQMGGDPEKINPLLPSELVIDHSVQVDEFGTAQALGNNTKLEFERNKERYESAVRI